MSDKKLIAVQVPESLARELERIDWDKVPDSVIAMFKSFIPMLKAKGYLKKQ